MTDIKIPVGIENFETIRTSGFYYIDKTSFIIELLQEAFSVNLITRPRRFGKTLMMSMLKNFFDIRKNSREIFEGLEIANHSDICNQWLNQWPVLFISFKDVVKQDFEKAYAQLAFNISSLYIEHAYLLESDKVDEADCQRFIRLRNCEASEIEIENSLFTLTRMMYAHYGKQVIFLIDEYDVPLAKANEYGYYQKMLDVIRGIMNTALKTNDYLKFAVVTGCLRIAKESIFTGTNLFVMNSIHDGGYMNSFGFTETEVKQLLEDAGFENQLFEMKQWYDGYQFDKYEIYCPWDVVNHVAALLKNPNKKPGNYWRDTSHNNIIRQFIGNEKLHVNEQFEELLAGGLVKVRIYDNLTYEFENSTEDNFWSILYLTGYLTKEKMVEDNNSIYLKIPNEEVKTIFADTIVQWFKDTMQEQNRDELFKAWWNGDDMKLTEMVSEILFDTISYYDYREDFYHAFLAGLFTGAGYHVSSNMKNGLGRTDIVVKDRKKRQVIIIEAKRSDSEKQMPKDCLKALKQIQSKQYAKSFQKGYKNILCYGVAFCDKTCLIQKMEVL